MGKSQGKRVPHIGQKGGSKREHGENRVDSTVKKGRLLGDAGGQPKRTSLEVGENMNG